MPLVRGDADAAEYELKLKEARESHHLPPNERPLFVEVRGAAADRT